jgi:hypothetical protein
MAAPVLAAALSSSAGARTTIVEAVRATSSPATAGNPGLTFASSGGIHGGLFAGVVFATLALALWFKRIL